jgi:hypothetical protein
VKQIGRDQGRRAITDKEKTKRCWKRMMRGIVKTSCMRTANPKVPKVPGRILLLIRMRYVNFHPPLAAIPLSETGQRPFCCNPALLAMGFCRTSGTLLLASHQILPLSTIAGICHKSLSATIGSTRHARRAGTIEARIEMTPSSAPTAPKDSASVAVTLKSKFSAK